VELRRRSRMESSTVDRAETALNEDVGA